MVMAGRLARVVLEGEALTRLSPLQEADRAQAVVDLETENAFAPAGLAGPFVLHLSIHEGRLVFDIRDGSDRPLAAHVLALGPFRKLIKDYQMLVDSHIEAVREGREPRIQAIDMGRRGLHNEGAGLDARAARRQDRDRLRDGAAAVHPGLCPARAVARECAGMKVDGTPMRSIWVDADGWTVRIIDQTKLPWSLEVVGLTDVDAAAHAIRNMQVRGAPLIGATAAYGLCLALRRDSATACDGARRRAARRHATDRRQSALGARAHADAAAQHRPRPNASPPPIARPPPSPRRMSPATRRSGGMASRSSPRPLRGSRG